MSVAFRPVAGDPPTTGARRWGHESGRFRALHHEFGVRTTDPTLGSYLEHVFSGFAAPGVPARWYSVVQQPGPTGRGTEYVVDFDGEPLVTTFRPSMAMGMLLWHVNQETVRRSSALTLVHASAAERHGIAGVFPAPMESGKTTLVAGLVRAGLRYLTDEAAAIDPCRLQVVPFPKAMSVDPGSWGVLADLRPSVDDAVFPFVRKQWQVVPADIRPHAVAPPTPVRLVVCPAYVEGARTTLEPLSRAQALRLLTDSTFLFAQHGRRNFETLARVAGASDCYRLTIGELGPACELVMALFDDIGAGTAVADDPEGGSDAC